MKPIPFVALSLAVLAGWGFGAGYFALPMIGVVIACLMLPIEQEGQ